MFRKLFSILLTPKTLLGRWTPTDVKKNNIKLDWANVDHCGTCSYEVKKPKTPDETKDADKVVDIQPPLQLQYVITQPQQPQNYNWKTATPKMPVDIKAPM